MRASGGRLRWLFRGLLVLTASLATLAVAELGLRMLDREPRLPAFVSKSRYLEYLSAQNLQKPTADELGDGFRYARDLARTGGFPLPPGSLAVPKPPATYRIFTFGGSTTFGLPFTQAGGRDRDVSFPSWLELRLQDRYPELQIEVHNAGAIGQTFEGAVDYAMECLAYEPDLFVFYSGHNEFLPHALLLARARQSSSTVLPAGSRWLDWRLGRAWQHFTVSLAEQNNPRLGTLDFPMVEKMVGECYHSRAESEVIQETLRRNLTRLFEGCSASGVRLAMCTVACNLLDFEPSLSYVPEAAAGEVPDDAQIKQLEQRFEELRVQLAQGGAERIHEELSRLPGMASSLAEAHFLAGRASLAMRDREAALEELGRSRDFDGVIRRAPSWVNDEFRTFARDHDTLLVDVEKAMWDRSAPAAPGNGLFYDHVHPTLEGTEVLVDTLETALVQSEWIPGNPAPPIAHSTAEELRELGFVPQMLAVVNSSQAIAYGGLILLRLYSPQRRLAEASRLIAEIPQVPVAQFLRAQVFLACLELIAGEKSAGLARIEQMRQVDPDMTQRVLSGFIERSASSAIREIFVDADLIEAP